VDTKSIVVSHNGTEGKSPLWTSSNNVGELTDFPLTPEPDQFISGSALLADDMRAGLLTLSSRDPELYSHLTEEHLRQLGTLSMVASASVADPSVLVCAGSAIANLTTEGYPGGRFHGGCGVADKIERLAIERAKLAFNAEYANVQPHSCSTANQAVMFALLQAGDTILGLDLKAGGHLTHGSKASCSGKYFHSVAYGLDDHGLIDYASVRQLAQQHRPKLIICGASAYPREIRFDVFRDIADSVGALLLADISHIAGLVVAGLHPSPIDTAHVTTTSTYKQLYGPRGGLILLGRERGRICDSRGITLEEAIQRGVFPFFQGTPDLAAIAAKARALHQSTTPEFVNLARRIVENAKALAEALVMHGYDVLTGGTDNHIVLLSLLDKGITGTIAERALDECGVIVNKNMIDGDTRSSSVCSGLRFGTNTLACRGMGVAQMRQCVHFINHALTSLKIKSDREYELPAAVREVVSREVASLCRAFPLPGYSTSWSVDDGADV
jgi:glycine hydroxymethyltransferase